MDLMRSTTTLHRLCALSFVATLIFFSSILKASGPTTAATSATASST